MEPTPILTVSVKRLEEQNSQTQEKLSSRGEGGLGINFCGIQ
jgi:hypothetical protein